MNTNTNTNTDAIEYVATCIEASGAASRDEYDMEAIVRELYGVNNPWDMDRINEETFWAVVEAHAL